MKASIDVGSNTILLLVAEVSGGKVSRELANESRVVGLGKDLDKTGGFLPEKMDVAFNVFKEYKKIIDENSVSEVVVTATEAARVANNSRMFFERVQKELGLKVTIISSEAEAYLSGLGVASHIDNSGNELVVMDIGGASTEFIKIKKDPFEVSSSISLPIGSVRGTDWLENEEFDQKVSEVLIEFEDRLPNFETGNLVCTAGTLTSLAGIFKELKTYDKKLVEGLKLTKVQLDEICENLSKRDPDGILEAYPFLGKRSLNIYAGSLIAKKLTEKLKVTDMIVSTYGVRYGSMVIDKIPEKFILD